MAKHRTAVLLGLLAAVALGGCGNAEAGSDIAGTYTVLDGSRMAPAQLTHLATVKLGIGDSVSFVNDVVDMAVSGDTIYVLDSFDYSVKVFSRDGDYLFRFGRKGEGPGEFIDPFDIEVENGLTMVADPGRGRAINLFTPSGEFIEWIEVETTRTQTAFDVYDNRLYILTPAIRFPEREGWNILTVATHSGEVLSKGCRLDPRYIASARRNGIIHRNQYGKVRTFNGRVYCSQTISPVIQVMDSLGLHVDSIAVAPPFYLPPPDIEFVANQKAIFDWFSKWTVHSNFWPVEGGWVASYNTFDQERGEMVYSIFACRYPEAEPTCTAVDDFPKPLLAESFDRIYALGNMQPGETVHLEVYKLAF